ncbi:hypothetical protein VNI00_004951 [Paramarasmius palmivorus]|uniref:Uncharacterized protein n=1 Tax=Paramarasmius palmivorus TaxID=297713 RepID=A0AAW0DJ27_9AGAR
MKSLFSDEDVVADSEGEDDYISPPTLKQKDRVNPDQSAISLYTSNPPVAGDDISSFGGASSSVANTSTSSTRPRPTTAYKGAPGNDSISTSSDVANVKSTRPRPRPAYKGAPGYEPQPQPELSNSKDEKQRQANNPEIIELTDDDDDELAIRPKKKATRAKAPKTKAKPTRVIPSPSPQPSFAAATSPLIPNSTLPPSDPPVSTPSEFSVGLPPIAVMPHIPSSSSSSSKRKRTPERDELDGDIDVYSEIFGDAPPLAPAPPAKKTKEKKPREKKTKKASDEGDKAKSKPKSKKKAKGQNDKEPEGEQAFKSAEFIDDSDDELNLDSVVAKPSGSGSSQTATSRMDEEQESEPPRKKQKQTSAKGKGKDTVTNTNRKGRVVMSDDEEEYAGEECVKEVEVVIPVPVEKRNPKTTKKSSKQTKAADASVPGPSSPVDKDVADKEVELPPKENIEPMRVPDTPVIEKPPIPNATTSETPNNRPTSLTSRYSIAPRTRSTPMSELIRRVNAQPGSPFQPPSATKTPTPYAKPGTPTAYSPYLKSSRSMLSRIAPLHPNRRTPPPLPPPPPPKKKSKKELELEERWEEELVEDVGGMTEWLALSDQERKDMRKAKREKELFGWEE